MKLTARKTWIISDTHFNHMKMCEYCGRPEDFSQRIVSHWRKMIAPEDLVYHLGDFYLGRRGGFVDYVNMLPGVKILIKGNHDREKSNWYLNRGFVAVMDFAAVVSRTNISENKECFLYTRVLLSHKLWDFQNLGSIKQSIFMDIFMNILLSTVESMIRML